MTFKRKEVIGNCTLYLGDCAEILPSIPRNVAVVSDPPYGMNWDTDTKRFTGGHNPKDRTAGRNDDRRVANDDKPFDPTVFLQFPEVILFGANHFASRLPVGSTLVWIKKLDQAYGSFLSDAELAWEKGGHGVYCHRDLSMNAITNSRVHPTQKPVGIMAWCLNRVSATTVLDPFMGSATTGIAAMKLGKDFIGIEIDEGHFETACQRIRDEGRQADIFGDASAANAPVYKQQSIFGGDE
jgi:DNA modification methylase